MTDELMAIEKKIQSTEEELARLKLQLNPNSTEFVFSSAVLVKRLLELKEQKRELEKNTEDAVETDTNLSTLHSEAPETPVEPVASQDFKRKEKLTLVLSGKGIGQGSISIRVLSSILHHLQSLTDQIAHSVHSGPILENHIPAHILRQSDLTVRQTFPGSFGIELEAAVEPSPGLEESLLSQSLHKLFTLLHSTNQSSQLMQELVSLGSHSLAHYRQWMSFMADQGIRIKCDWKQAEGDQTSWEADSEMLTAMVKTLEAIRVDRTREKEIIGSFMGMNIRNHTFEIMNHETFEIIEGKSHREILMKSRQWIGEKAKMKMVKCVAENSMTGEEKVLWYLREIHPISTG